MFAQQVCVCATAVLTTTLCVHSQTYTQTHTHAHIRYTFCRSFNSHVCRTYVCSYIVERARAFKPRYTMHECVWRTRTRSNEAIRRLCVRGDLLSTEEAGVRGRASILLRVRERVRVILHAFGNTLRCARIRMHTPHTAHSL